ncbi:MAG: glycosyltransferase [Thermoleophilia bacterium]
MRILIVSLYWPPAGGPGVQRPLTFAKHLVDLGAEVHVLAPDDPKWLHRDESLVEPPGVVVHRVRNLGPRSRRPAEDLKHARGLDRIGLQAQIAFRKVLVPDAAVLWNATAIPAALRLVRRHRIDWVMTTSPPGSVHLVGRAVQARTDARWVADVRDSISFHSHRRRDVRGERRLARMVAQRADAIAAASIAIAEETRRDDPRGALAVIGNGCDFDDFAGLAHVPGERFRITHTGSFFGRRDPRPFLDAVARADEAVVARFVGDFRTRDREHAAALGILDRLELVPYLPRGEALRLQRDSEALLLLIPEADGRGKGILSGKVFEYLAAERPILAAVPPDGEAAALIREVGGGVVVPSDDVDAIGAALAGLVADWRAGRLAATPLAPEARERLSRRARSVELLDLLGRADSA